MSNKLQEHLDSIRIIEETILSKEELIKKLLKEIKTLKKQKTITKNKARSLINYRKKLWLKQ